MQKIYALLVVGISVACCAGEHFDTQQAMRKRHEQIEKVTREMNVMGSDGRITLYNTEQVAEFIEKTKNKKDDEIKAASNGHYIFMTRYGRIISVELINVPNARL